MPFVTVKAWEEKAKRVIQGITQVFVEMDIPQQVVSVVVQEIPKTHWGIGGEPASERGKS